MEANMDSDMSDLIVDERTVSSAPRYSVERIRQSIRDFATLSEALRLLGAVVILASMSMFLLEGWYEGNDIRRYLILLGQTGLLAAGGFTLSHGLKENKGARIFFGLTLISIPANFTILGALLYSIVQWDGALVAYPDFATWRIVDAGATGMTLGGAMLALIPATMLCFAIMARRSFGALSLHFMLLNSLLLLPVRSSTTVGLVALIGTMYALFAVRRLLGNDSSLKTPEGKFALATLFIPVGIVMFRSMYFYQIDSLLIAMLSLGLFMIFRQVSMTTDRLSLAAVMDVLALTVAMSAAMSLAATIEQIVAPQFLAPTTAVAFAVLALDVARRTASRQLATWSTAMVILLAGFSFVFNAVVYDGALTIVACVLAGAVMALIGHGFSNRVAMVTGYATVAAGLVFGLSDILEMIRHSSWVELAIFGASAIAVGSVLDRHGAALKLRFATRIAKTRRSMG